MLYKTIFTWLTGTRYGGSGGTQEVVSNRLIHVHTHLTHRTVVTPWKKNMDVMISIIHKKINQSHNKSRRYSGFLVCCLLTWSCMVCRSLVVVQYLVPVPDPRGAVRNRQLPDPPD